MTIWLRQSTASQEVPLGYFVDSSDGDAEETGLTVANTDIKIWKSGATTLANKNSGGATHISNGIYYAVLDATDTNTLGPLVIFVHVSGALTVRLECLVLPAAVYDSLVAGSDTLPADVTQWNGTNVATPDTAGYPKITIKSGTGTGEISLTSGRANANLTHIGGSAVSTTTAQLGVNVVQVSGDSVAADNLESYCDGTTPQPVNVTQISGDSTAADNLEMAADGTGYNLGGGSVVAASVTGNVGGNVTGSVGSLATQAKADVNAEVDTALADVRLDELLAADSDIDGATPPTVGSVFHELMSKTAGSFTFDQTTDSLEAVRDRGDAAWTTATGFSTHSASDVWSVGTRVLTAGTNIQLPSNGLANVTAWTVDITGDLSGSVGSVTGNVGGNVTGDVGGVGTGAITSSSFASGAITDSAIASNAITAAKIAADAIGASELAADAVTEIQNGLATSTNQTTILGRLGAWTGSGRNTILGALQALFRKDSDATVPTDVNADLGSGAGTADNTTDSTQAIRDRGDAAWLTATGFSTHSAADVWAVGTRTLTAATNISGPIADAVWDEAVSGHTTDGTYGKAFSGATSVYVVGIAGTINTLDALDTAQDTQHSATQTLVTTVDTVADAIKAKTDNLPASPAATSDIPSAATIADAVLDDAITEPSGVFAWGGATLRNIVGWLGALSRNKLTQTADTQTLRNDADDDDLGTASVSDDGTTATRGKWG